jgi:hypothetical protein
MGIYGKTAPSIDIRAVSEEMQPVIEEWFNAEIQIIDPHIETGAFNRVTNTKTRVAPDILWQGPARIQAVRWPNVATSRQEAVSTRTVVFHIPLSAEIDPGLIQEGYRVSVVDGAMSPEFEDGLFVITTTINSSYAWNRRIECMMDQGAVIG